MANVAEFSHTVLWEVRCVPIYEAWSLVWFPAAFCMHRAGPSKSLNANFPTASVYYYLDLKDANYSMYTFNH